MGFGSFVFNIPVYQDQHTEDRVVELQSHVSTIIIYHSTIKILENRPTGKMGSEAGCGTG
jgi:hypothetical protein